MTTPREDAETLVAVVRKNKTEEIRVRLARFKGADFLDLRIFAELDGGGGRRLPTKRGVAVGLSRIPDLVEALRAAEAEAARQGLIGGGRQ